MFLSVAYASRCYGQQNQIQIFLSHFRNKIAEVRILEEIEPENFGHEIRLISRDRFKSYPATSEQALQKDTKIK